VVLNWPNIKPYWLQKFLLTSFHHVFFISLTSLAVTNGNISLSTKVPLSYNLISTPLFFTIYLFIWERETVRWVWGEAEGENLQADSPLSMEPDAGLDPMTREIITRAETKSRMLKQLSHPGTSNWYTF